MLTDRRSVLRGIGLLMAAPLIVRAGSLMPVRVWADESNCWDFGLPHGVACGETVALWARRLMLGALNESYTRFRGAVVLAHPG